MRRFRAFRARCARSALSRLVAEASSNNGLSGSALPADGGYFFGVTEVPWRRPGRRRLREGHPFPLRILSSTLSRRRRAWRLSRFAHFELGQGDVATIERHDDKGADSFVDILGVSSSFSDHALAAMVCERQRASSIIYSAASSAKAPACARLEGFTSWSPHHVSMFLLSHAACSTKKLHGGQDREFKGLRRRAGKLGETRA